MGRFKPREDPTRSEKLVNHLATRTATKHAEWQPDGAWAVLDDLAVDPLPPRPGLAVRCGRSSRPGQVEQHHDPLGSRTQ
jgi:hypothetical protein